MLEDKETSQANGGAANKVQIVAMVIGAIYVGISGYFIASLRSQVADQAAAQQRQEQRVETLESKLKQTSTAVSEQAEQAGMANKQFDSKVQQLQSSQHAAEARLSQAQEEQMAKVNNQMNGVATEVGSVKSDLGATKSDLEATKAKLESAIGDLHIQSGLIARTHDDLEILKHKGDRNYYEFALKKGSKPVAVSTVSLQLKKVDQKRNKFTLNVLADDKTIEKKDRTALEPLQFYTGKDRLLYELVVNDIQKDQVSGYIATPKNAPQPVTQ